MGKRRRWLIAGFATLVVLAALGAVAGHVRAGRMDRPDRVERSPLCHMLSLSPEQQTRLATIDAESLARLRPLEEQLLTAREDLYHALSAPNPDRRRIDRQIEEVARLQAQAQREVVDHLLAVRAILSEQQQAGFFQALEPRMGCGRCGQGAGGCGANAPMPEGCGGPVEMPETP